MFRKSVAVAIVLLLTSAAVHAAPLGLNPSKPDIATPNLSISYVEGTDKFLVEGLAGDIYAYTPSEGAPMEDVFDATYMLMAEIDSTGALQPGGTVEIHGNLSFAPAELLLSGDLTAFGFDVQGDPSHAVFEFEFDVTGGSLQSDFGGIGAPGGIIISGAGDTGFANDFTEDFGTDGAHTAKADNFAIPEPTSMILLAGGLAGFLGRRTTRRARRNVS